MRAASANISSTVICQAVLIAPCRISQGVTCSLPTARMSYALDTTRPAKAMNVMFGTLPRELRVRAAGDPFGRTLRIVEAGSHALRAKRSVDPFLVFF
jgi:hypothetical protein